VPESVDEQADPLLREIRRPDGATYVVKAVTAGELLRDYGLSGSAADFLLVIVEMAAVGLRRFVRPGWTVGVFLWRRRRLPRLVHKEHLAPSGDPARSVQALVEQLNAGWRPKDL